MIFMFNTHHVHKHSFLSFLPSYLARQAKSEVKELFLNSAILDLAVAMILFFEPIYLFQQGQKRGFTAWEAILGILFFYLAVYFLYFWLMPFGGKFTKRYGFEHSIYLASPLLILFYLCLTLVDRSLYFLVPAAFFYALQKTFYWPGYHCDFADHGKDAEQGREVSNITVIISFVFILGPLIGGTIMHFLGFWALFVIVSILIIISNLPLLLTPERFTPGGFSYFSAFKRLVKRENFRSLLAYLGFGEELVALVLWPIFMIILLNTTLSAGAFVALSTLITAVIVLYIGRVSDKRPKRQVLRFTSIFYAMSWFFRILVYTPIGVLLFDTFGRVGKNSLSVPLIAFTYKRARERGVVENVIFFEMSLVLGKILMMILAILIILFIPMHLFWIAIFILAGLFTLLYTLL